MTGLFVSTNASRGVPAGGIVAVDGWRVTTVDKTPTTGMCFVGDILARARWTRTGPTVIDIGEASITVPAADVHDLAWDGEHLVVVSAGTNEILWVELDGTVVRRWCPHPADDSWHLSGVSVASGTVVVSAFGDHDVERGWAEHLGETGGFLLDVNSGEPVVSGLRAPHSPVRADDGWWWCDSYDGAVHGPAGTVQVGGWTRGLVVTDEFVYVGSSPWRGHGDGERPEEPSGLMIIDRDTLEVAATITIGPADIFSIVLPADPEVS